MTGPRPRPADGKLSDLEAKLLAAAVGGRLFNRPAEPVQLGRYRLQERIGQGGMGVVFRAHDPQLHRDVAIKLLHAARDGAARDQQARLRREALALGRLSHPNVVQVFEVGEADEHMFVAMELVRGATLRAWLGERPRGLAETLAIVLQVGRGLAAAHAAGLVHRDLKPENVLVGADGRARVVDFGLARAAPGPEGATASSLERPLTASGMLLGTPAFMAPEQVRDPTRADARADQFSFCVLAYDALYGERPFAERGADAAPAIRPAPAGSPVPPALRAALLRGLRDAPSERWPTMEALLAAIEDATRTAPPRPRSSAWLAWIAVTTLLLASLVTLLVLARQPTTEPALLPTLPALPAVQDTARAGQVALLLADGRLADAADLQATLLESPLAADARSAIEALQARTTATLAARTDLALRFTGAASSPWTELEPSALRADPSRPSLVIDAQPGDRPLVAWSFLQTTDRVLVDLTLTPQCLAPGARFTVRAVGDETRAELGLQVSATNDLELRCDTTTTRLATLGPDGEHPPLALQLDLDVAGTTCRVHDEHGHARVRSHAAAAADAPGPLRLELRGDPGSDPTCARIELTRVVVTGASPGPHEPAPLARAGASLVDDDAHAAAQALAGLGEPQATLWQAIALARLGRWQAGAPLLQRAIADDATRRELSAWFRGDPRVLAPALQQMLGEPAYLELLAATWRPTRETLSPALVRSILATTGELMERCEVAICAALLHARGRALTQLHEPAAAMRAFDAALAVVPADPAGRALASRILVDRSLLGAPPGTSTGKTTGKTD